MAAPFDALLARMADTLGDRLVAVYAFGSKFARAPQAPESRLLVLVDALDASLLDDMLPISHDAQQARVLLRLDTARDVLRCADVMPVFALELLKTRKRLHGEDVLADLEVHPEHLVLHLEQSLRAAHRELLRGYLASTDDRAIARSLREQIRRAVTLLGGLALVRGLELSDPTSPESTANQVIADLCPEDVDLWRRLVRFGGFQVSLEHDGLLALYSEALVGFSGLVDVVDRLN